MPHLAACTAQKRQAYSVLHNSSFRFGSVRFGNIEKASAFSVDVMRASWVQGRIVTEPVPEVCGSGEVTGAHGAGVDASGLIFVRHGRAVWGLMDATSSDPSISRHHRRAERREPGGSGVERRLGEVAGRPHVLGGTAGRPARRGTLVLVGSASTGVAAGPPVVVQSPNTKSVRK